MVERIAFILWILVHVTRKEGGNSDTVPDKMALWQIGLLSQNSRIRHVFAFRDGISYDNPKTRARIQILIAHS